MKWALRTIAATWLFHDLQNSHWLLVRIGAGSGLTNSYGVSLYLAQVKGYTCSHHTGPDGWRLRHLNAPFPARIDCSVPSVVRLLP